MKSYLSVLGILLINAREAVADVHSINGKYKWGYFDQVKLRRD